jgi:hypothetical protein
VIARAVGPVVVARPIAVVVGLWGVLERLAWGAGAVLARGLGALRAGVQRVGTLVGPLLAIVGLAMMAGGAAWPAPGRRATAAAVAAGVGRFHWRRV